LNDCCFYWLHQSDVINLSILAVDGYGHNGKEEAMKSSIEAPTKRNDHWNDSLDGATLCCNQCCDILGSASIGNTDTYRLLKHKISAPATEMTHEFDHLARYTCSSFIANELVRYAEMYGIFNFSIVRISSGFSDTKEYNHNRSENALRILIHVISWNAEMGHAHVDGDDIIPFQMQLRPVVKVVFEESGYTTRRLRPFKVIESSYGVDACCSPWQLLNEETESLKERYCQMFLSEIEWNELRDTLNEGKTYFDDTTSLAAVSLRLGVHSEIDNNDKASLTVLLR
jgi:hypothetical protein